MIVTNSTWQRVGVANPSSAIAQNVGTCRIAYVFAASQPAVDAYALDSDEHFILAPGSSPIIIKDLNNVSKSMYARALGPNSGQLAVETVA